MGLQGRASIDGREYPTPNLCILFCCISHVEAKDTLLPIHTRRPMIRLKAPLPQGPVAPPRTPRSLDMVPLT